METKNEEKILPCDQLLVFQSTTIVDGLKYNYYLIENSGQARIFLLVDLREFLFRFRDEGKEKKGKKSSENDQLTGHFQSLFFFSELFFF